MSLLLLKQRALVVRDRHLLYQHHLLKNFLPASLHFWNHYAYIEKILTINMQYINRSKLFLCQRSWNNILEILLKILSAIMMETKTIRFLKNYNSIWRLGTQCNNKAASYRSYRKDSEIYRIGITRLGKCEKLNGTSKLNERE